MMAANASIKKQRSVEICYAATSLIFSECDLSNSDWVAPGIGLYGVGHPSLKPVLQLQAQVIAQRSVEEGMPIGYRGQYKAERVCSVSYLGIGYADGLPLHMGAYKGGDIACVAGEVSMDLMNVLLSSEKKSGQWVNIWQSQEDITNLAQCSGVLEYVLMSALGQRVKRYALPTLSHLRYMCRRGVLELDRCLELFLDKVYRQLSGDDKLLFQELLGYSDPQLQAYFFIDGADALSPPMQRLIETIKDCSLSHVY